MGDKITGYRKTYRLRIAVPGRKSIEVTFPYEIVEREARERGLSVEEFMARFYAVVHYDNFKGARYTFEAMPT